MSDQLKQCMLLMDCTPISETSYYFFSYKAIDHKVELTLIFLLITRIQNDCPSGKKSRRIKISQNISVFEREIAANFPRRWINVYAMTTLYVNPIKRCAAELMATLE